MNLLNWDFTGDPVLRLDSFERERSQYEAATKEKLSDSISIGIVLNRLPQSPLKEHLVLNAERLKTC